MGKSPDFKKVMQIYLCNDIMMLVKMLTKLGIKWIIFL